MAEQILIDQSNGRVVRALGRNLARRGARAERGDDGSGSGGGVRGEGGPEGSGVSATERLFAIAFLSSFIAAVAVTAVVGYVFRDRIRARMARKRGGG